MDQSLPNQQNLQQVIREQPQTKENKKPLLKALALLEVGIIEIVFVGIVYPWKSCQFEFAKTGVK